MTKTLPKINTLLKFILQLIIIKGSGFETFVQINIFINFLNTVSVQRNSCLIASGQWVLFGQVKLLEKSFKDI